ncbi:hypothetical protein [Halorussus halophilus]|uniref:hypothetical protein n=1 Tax=Halorussus halophilus TaxID=2650975 RepID=UPI001301682F|nr:hypothetical protein [Halorussus halophilus]
MLGYKRIFAGILVVALLSSGALAYTQFPTYFQRPVEFQDSPPFVHSKKPVAIDAAPKLTELAANRTGYEISYEFTRTQNTDGDVVHRNGTETLWFDPQSKSYVLRSVRTSAIPAERQRYGPVDQRRHYRTFTDDGSLTRAYTQKIYGTKFGPYQQPQPKGYEMTYRQHHEDAHRFDAYGEGDYPYPRPGAYSQLRGSIEYVTATGGFGLVKFKENGRMQHEGEQMRRFEVIVDRTAFEKGEGELLEVENASGYLLVDSNGRAQLADVTFHAHYRDSGTPFVWTHYFEVDYTVERPSKPAWAERIDAARESA